MRCPRPIRLSLLLLVLAPFARAQSYTSLVVFGDSLSDTGNIAHLTQSSFGLRYPGPLFNYADGRFTDSTATVPASSAHAGVWVDQLAAALPAGPAVTASLDGGTNYAYGDATTADGTTTVTETTGVSITLNNMGQQVTDYLAAHPAVPVGTLVVVWGGSNDLSAAATATSPQQVQTIVNTAVTNEVALVQRLIAAGATDILVPNLPPLGLIPRFNINPTLSAAATAAAMLFNSGLQTALAALPPSATVRVVQLDTFALFNSVVQDPAANGLVNIQSSSQGSAVDPDQYLFWDDLHPTTTGHHLVAAAALALITPPPSVSTTTVLTSSALTANLGSSVTFTATVTAAASAPVGTVTFSDGATSLGTGTLAADTATTSTATLTTSSLAAGTHTITAAFGGSTGFAASTSAAITQTVVAPGVTATLSPTTITVKRGETATSTVTLGVVGGFGGTVKVECGSLPAFAMCTISSGLSPSTDTVYIATDNKSPAVPAAVLLPLFGGVLFAFARKGRLRSSLLAILVAVSGMGLLGLAGCSDSGKRTASGTYTVPINVTPSTGAATTLNLTLIVK